jgi:aminocarboxymuconate-semialdehyde decarboxylase
MARDPRPGSLMGNSPAVDVHVHAIPPALLARVATGRAHGVRVNEAGHARVFTVDGASSSPPAPPSLFDPDAMSSWRESRGIDLMMVGPWTDLLGYTLPASQGESWARTYNEELVGMAASRRGMAAMGTIPLQSPGAAVAALHEARSIGCRGLVIGTDLPDTDLADERLDDVWAAAAEVRMPILVHPTMLEVPEELRPNGLKNAVGRAAETSLALTKLVYSGVLERHPNLLLIASHGGGGFVPLLARIVRNQEMGWADSDVDVAASVRRLYFDSVVLDGDVLRFLASKVGADRILLGSDHPFPWESDPIERLRSASLDAATADAIRGGNARALFDLG